jgi:hypothetical protein
MILFAGKSHGYNVIGFCINIHLLVSTFFVSKIN